MIRKIGQNKVQGRIYTWPLMKCVIQYKTEYEIPVLCAHAVVVDTQETVTGYTDDGVVVLTCEVYGYLRSNNLTVEWLRETGGTRQPLQNTQKYTIEYSNGSHLIQNPDGTTTARQRTVANLTIHQLAPADAGRYICETGWEEEAYYEWWSWSSFDFLHVAQTVLWASPYNKFFPCMDHQECTYMVTSSSLRQQNNVRSSHVNDVITCAHVCQILVLMKLTHAINSSLTSDIQVKILT